jgi:hypothetical protein
MMQDGRQKLNGYVLPISRLKWCSSVAMQSKMIVAPPSDPTRSVPLTACVVVGLCGVGHSGSELIEDQFSGEAKLDQVRWLNR